MTKLALNSNKTLVLLHFAIYTCDTIVFTRNKILLQVVNFTYADKI